MEVSDDFFEGRVLIEDKLLCQSHTEVIVCKGIDCAIKELLCFAESYRKDFDYVVWWFVSFLWKAFQNFGDLYAAC